MKSTCVRLSLALIKISDIRAELFLYVHGCRAVGTHFKLILGSLSVSVYHRLGRLAWVHHLAHHVRRVR